MRMNNLLKFFRDQIVPFLCSLFLHIILFIILAFLKMSANPQVDWPHAPPKAKIRFSGEEKTQLQFQGKEKLDNFKVLHRMVYPLPEIDYRPVLPKIHFDPQPKSKETLRIIGLQAIDHKSELTFASGRQPFYTGEEKLATSFGEYIQLLREGGLDVVFVFDSTSSMAQVLREVKQKVSYLTQTIWRLVPTARIGLVTYRDVGDAYVTKELPLTYSLQKLVNFLREIEPEGGGDLEESVDEGLRVAIEESAWRKKAKKMVILMGDAPPHENDIQKSYSLVDRFRMKKKGVVCSLDTSVRSNVTSENSLFDETPGIMESFSAFAEIGGGESTNLIEVERLIRQMVVLIFGTRWEEFLDEFLKTL
jgi:hypothetical protein